MRSNWRPLTCALLSTCFVLLLTACGLSVSKAGLFAGSDAATVSIALTGPTTVTLGGQSQYAATVTGSSDNSVTWSVNGVAGGNASVGSISSQGLYLAPVSAPQSSKVTITATSVASPAASQSLGVALAALPKSPSGASSVTLLLNGPTSVTLGTSAQYAATVTGASDTAVNWSVNGVTGGSAAVGFISAAGLYTAPASAPPSSTATITATSAADPSASQSVAVTLVAPPTQPPVDGGSGVTLSLTGPTKVTLGSSAQYTATVTGSSNTAVIWSVNGVVGGDTALGSISQKGTYTGPAMNNKWSKVNITATSVADPSVSESVAVTLVVPESRPTVELTLIGATRVMLGTSAQYTATVTGSSNTGVTWSVNGVVGGDSAYGFISATGRYTAPASAAHASQATITATSAADPSVAQSLIATLTVAPPPPPAVTLTLSGAMSVVLGTSSKYAATVTGSSDTSVTWSVDGIVGGDRTVGSISGNGLYTAPASAPQSSKVTITATSNADPSVAQSLAVALNAPKAPTVTLALSGAMSVVLGTSSKYAATVTGSSDTSVTWSVDGIVGGDRTVGSISGNGLYTAPSSAPQSSKVTIMATSNADPSVAQSLAVALNAPKAPTVTLALSGATTVVLGTPSQYAATVKGSTNTAVTWSVDGVMGGNPTVGSISAKGLYTAPVSAPNSSKITITATSVANPAVSQSLVVTLAAPPPPPSVSLTLSGATSVNLGSSSQYVATVSGSSNTGVTWSVNGVVGGNATDGTISAKGLYTAPTTAPQPSTVTITATSVADTSVAKSLVTTLVTPTPNDRIPAYAISSGPLDASTRWQWSHDAGTPGSSQGSTVYPVSGLSADNVAREFYMTYSDHGGEIYHVSFATDKNATHFIYDTYVYVVDPSQLANLEMDMNDVMPDGQTVILGTQCSTYSKSWEYTLQANGGFHWHPSNIPCNPETWSAKTWHHIQIASHRDSVGTATYDWIGFDGAYSDFQNASGNSSRPLGWAIGDLLINFQIDGASAGSGSNTIYTDQLTVYRW